MTRTVCISLDQFFRPQPGGIATYARGLVGGLVALDGVSTRMMGVAPRSVRGPELSDLDLEIVRAPASLHVLTRLWAKWPLGVPSSSDVVHATSLAGPFGGGRPGAVHSVALHDLLWRDEPSASTARGIRFHERRLTSLRRRRDVRLITTAPGLARRLIDEGFAVERLHEVRLGVDDATTPASAEHVVALLADHGVDGRFTLYVGTREPRKNLDRLINAHARALRSAPELGPLVLVGPEGWGRVDATSAVVFGPVTRPLLKGLYRDATVFAYVPRAEGWGLPPAEALHQGTRVVASTTTPSVAGNDTVVRVDPLDVDAIAEGLVGALSLADDDEARRSRRESVAMLTWRNSALDHLAAWR